MIGATTSQSLDLTLLNKGDIVYGTSTIKVEIGLKIGNTIEYIPMGIYNIDDIEKTDYTIKITAFDNMMKFEKNFITNLGDTLTLQQVVNELVRITGVQFTGTLPTYTVKKLEGFSCREVLSYVASICGGNSVITRDGKFTIVMPKDNNYAIGTANYFDYTREETKYKIEKISCQAGEEVLSKGSIGADSMELEFENPWVTTTILNDIYTKLNGFEYLGYSMKWQGDLSLDVGDIVTITDKKGVVRKHPILSRKFTYTGGLTSEISAKGENKNKNEFSSSGPSTKKIERVFTELAIVNKALIGVAYIDDLIAGNIKFDTASGNVMDLQTLLVKFVSGENGQYLNLTSNNVVIATGVIKDAMIDTVNANKINTGTLDTNKVTVQGPSGNLLIKDNTIQIKDSTRVRVQIGKDASNDYNMYVWDATGKLMFDATGLKADGIKTPIIRDDMVSSNANINGSKLNISSLITEVNKDNTQTLKASKIAFDSTGQSLEVSFNSLKSNVDNIEIGGRNLLVGKPNVSTDITINSKSKFGIKFTVGDSGNVWRGWSGLSLEPDKDYVVSFVAWSTKQVNINCDLFPDELPEKIFTITTDVKKFIFNIRSISSKMNNCSLRFFKGGYIFTEDVYITDIKLEEGNKPTDWTPALEDIEEKIETNTTAITVAQGKIEGLIKESTITKGDVTTLKDNYTSIKATVDGISTTVASHTSSIGTLTSKVSTAESSITQLNNKIALKVEATEVNNIVNNAVDGIQVGGRNLLIGTSKIRTIPINTTNGYTAIDVYGTADSNSDARNGKTFSELGFVIGDKITVRFDWSTRQNGSAAITNGSYRVELRKNGTYKGGISSVTNFNTNKGVAEYYHTFTTNTLDSNQLCVRIDNSILLFDISNCKLEKGNKPTDWTPAPEDIDSDISTVDSKITTTNNKVASIEANLSSITQRVSSTESTVSTINGNVTNLTSRVSTAESKLTATSLTTTISSAINGGTSSITTTQFVMDKGGLTIKNGALTIKNKANANVLNSDTNGNLTITGTFINKNNNDVKAIEINNTNIYFYDWERNGRELGVIYSSYITDYPNVRGFSLAHNQQGYMTLGYRTGTNSFGHYITFDKYAKNPSYAAPIRVHESAVFHSAVNIQDRVYIPAKICFEGNYNATTPQIFKNTSDSRNILCTQVSVNAANDGYMLQSNTGSVLFSILAGKSYVVEFNQSVKINGNYTATGSKNSLQITKNYGERLINAYETAEYFFGDIGSGVIKNGECIVWIDDILQECINTDVEYHVFIQTYNGSNVIIERYKDYFIVFGEDNTKFSWELKAKRLGYENVRLDVPDIGTVEDIPVFTDEDLEVKTVEDTLLDVLTFELEDILMEG